MWRVPFQKQPQVSGQWLCNNVLVNVCLMSSFERLFYVFPHSACSQPIFKYGRFVAFCRA